MRTVIDLATFRSQGRIAAFVPPPMPKFRPGDKVYDTRDMARSGTVTAIIGIDRRCLVLGKNGVFSVSESLLEAVT